MPLNDDKPTRPRRFRYYAKLSREDKAQYRRSDAMTTLPVPDADALEEHLHPMHHALAAADPKRLRPPSQRLVSQLLRQFGAPSVEVRVLKVRPTIEDSEYHGLYEHVEGTRPVIRVWTRTAVNQHPVAFKTFFRTLLHEVVHHLDFTIHGLEESFHTQGFYERESHLVRQLFVATDVAPDIVTPPVVSLPSPQLSLFDPPE